MSEEAKTDALRDEIQLLREIADLTHRILSYGDWVVETPNEGALAKAFILLGNPLRAREIRRDIDMDYMMFQHEREQER